MAKVVNTGILIICLNSIYICVCVFYSMIVCYADERKTLIRGLKQYCFKVGKKFDGTLLCWKIWF